MGSDLTIGLLYLILGTLFVVIYCISIAAIARSKELYSNDCYKLMFWLGISDQGYTILTGPIAGIMTFAGTNFGHTVAKVGGAIIMMCWWTSSAIMSALALNRFLSSWSNGKWSNWTFGGQRAYFWLLGSFVYGLAGLGLFLTPHVESVYNVQEGGWFFNQDMPSTVLSYCMAQDIMASTFIVLFHGLVFLKFRNLFLSTSHGYMSAEIKQAFIPPFAIGALLVLQNIAFYVIPIVSTDKWVAVGLEVITFGASGANGVLYIVFNKTIRQSSFALLRIHQDSSTAAVLNPAGNNNSSAMNSCNDFGNNVNKSPARKPPGNSVANGMETNWKPCTPNPPGIERHEAWSGTH